MSKTHGLNKTRTHNIWVNMRQRCNNKKVPHYKYYGGRGIKVCKRWDKFENFYKDMGKISEGMSIDRIDVDGDYYKENCRIATMRSQQNNRRNNIKVNYNNERITLAEYFRKTKTYEHEYYRKIRNGQSLDEAIKSLAESRISKKVETTCKACGNKFKDYAGKKRKFCSNKCYYTVYKN